MQKQVIKAIKTLWVSSLLLRQFYSPFVSLVVLLLCSSTGVQTSAQTPDINGVVYVKPISTGTGNGDSWSNATQDLTYGGFGSSNFLNVK